MTIKFKEILVVEMEMDEEEYEESGKISVQMDVHEYLNDHLDRYDGLMKIEVWEGIGDVQTLKYYIVEDD